MPDRTKYEIEKNEKLIAVVDSKPFQVINNYNENGDVLPETNAGGTILYNKPIQPDRKVNDGDVLVYNADKKRWEPGTSGKIQAVSRYTTTQTLDSDDHIVFCDTDGGAWTLSLSAGIAGTHYKIINCGSSGNDLTVDPNGTEQLYGAGAGVASTLVDGEVIDIHYDVTEGWF